MIELNELERKTKKEAARRALRDIEEASGDGRIRARAVVEAAAHPDHELHRYFEWDDTKAAHGYRLAQARRIIRMVYVGAAGKPGEPTVRVPTYVNMVHERRKDGGWRNVREIVNSPELMQRWEEECKAELEAVLRRYEQLTVFCARVRRALKLESKKGKRRRPPQDGRN